MRDLRKQRYYLHKTNAKKRNLKMLMTFQEWWDIWEQSGHWEQRGNKRGQYCMSRFNDEGDYTKDNVFIQLHSQNLSDAQKGRVKSEAEKLKISINNGRRNHV